MHRQFITIYATIAPAGFILGESSVQPFDREMENE